IRWWRPDLLLTEEPQGGYGHPDHIRVHDIAMRAAALAADEWRIPVVAYIVRATDRVRAAQEWLAARDDLPIADAWGEPLRLAEMGGERPSIERETPDVVVDVRT